MSKNSWKVVWEFKMILNSEWEKHNLDQRLTKANNHNFSKFSEILTNSHSLAFKIWNMPGVSKSCAQAGKWILYIFILSNFINSGPCLYTEFLWPLTWFLPFLTFQIFTSMIILPWHLHIIYKTLRERQNWEFKKEIRIYLQVRRVQNQKEYWEIFQ